MSASSFSIAEYAAVTTDAATKLAEKCAATLKELVADPAGPGWATFFNVTQRLRAELAAEDPTAVLVHANVRQACYHAANSGMVAPLENVLDDGTITGATQNPPLVWFDGSAVPEAVQKFLGTWVDPNLVDPSVTTAQAVLAADPNATAAATLVGTNGSTVGVVYTTNTDLGSIVTVE